MTVSHRGLLVVVALIGLAAVVGIVALWPAGRPGAPPAAQELGPQTELLDATLTEIVELPDDGMGLLPGSVPVRLTARIESSGESVTFEMTDDTGDTFRAGQRVRLARLETPGAEPTFFVSDFRRQGPMAVLLALFFCAVVAFGRWQGLRALAGLACSFLVIIGFIVPAILGGRSPVAVALVGSLAIMLATLYLSHGWHRKTTAALVGTAAALLVTVALAWAFVTAASITGFTSEEARLATFEVGGLSLRGLVLAGIIIGGLGVLDDVTVAQAATVFELQRANPRSGYRDLVRGALNVGRDHIAATVNTLFLAYAGAALPLLILFTSGIDSLPTVITSEIVAVEVVRTLVGSIGLIAAVPLTTALAAALAMSDPRAAAREPGGHTHGHPQVVPGGLEAEDEDQWVRRLRDAYRLPPDRTESNG